VTDRQVISHLDLPRVTNSIKMENSRETEPEQVEEEEVVQVVHVVEGGQQPGQDETVPEQVEGVEVVQEPGQDEDEEPHDQAQSDADWAELAEFAAEGQQEDVGGVSPASSVLACGPGSCHCEDVSEVDEAGGGPESEPGSGYGSSEGKSPGQVDFNNIHGGGGNINFADLRNLAPGYPPIAPPVPVPAVSLPVAPCVGCTRRNDNHFETQRAISHVFTRVKRLDTTAAFCRSLTLHNRWVIYQLQTALRVAAEDRRVASQERERMASNILAILQAVQGGEVAQAGGDGQPAQVEAEAGGEGMEEEDQGEVGGNGQPDQVEAEAGGEDMEEEEVVSGDGDPDTPTYSPPYNNGDTSGSESPTSTSEDSGQGNTDTAGSIEY
jgi:hypothetical protein